MSDLYGRVWRVTIDTLASADLDVRFKVTRTLAQRAGTLELDVYNLAEDHRAQVRNYRTRAADGRVVRSRVRLEAGYAATGMSVLFQGDARRIHSVREPPDWVTKVTAGDGEDALRGARGARAFGPDSTLEEVVRYAAGAMGVGLGNLPDALAGATLDRVGGAFARGTVVHGRAARELEQLLRSAGLESSVQDGVLQVLPRGGHLTRTAVLLSPDTGLLGSPEVGLNRVVTCDALIQPDLVPGAQVRLESAVVTGYYRVEQVEGSGDTRGTDWTASLTLRRIRDDGTLVGGTQ